MERVTTPDGTSVSYEKSGSGPALVLVHGSFSDHRTNWELAAPLLRERFTLYAVARRGRGATDAAGGHSLEDEGRDVAGVIQAVRAPVFLLGHSYGAHCSLLAAAGSPDPIRKLVVYEPPWPATVTSQALARLEQLAARQAWDELAYTFFRDTLHVPVHELDALRAAEPWASIVADARASLGDLRAMNRFRFEAERYRRLDIPVLLLVGSESPRDLYVTDALAAVLPDARIEELAGQAHEGATTAPGMFAEAVTRFLLA